MNNITAIILNYNDWQTTNTLVSNIVDYKSINNIVIVDNCSKNESFSKLSSWKSKKVHVIKTNKNGGYGYGNNVGINFAKKFATNYFLICNPDVEFEEDLVDKMVEALNDNSLNVCCSAIPYQPNGKLQKKYAWRVPSALSATLACGKVLQKFYNFDWYPDTYCMEKKYTQVECVPGSLVMFNSLAIKELKTVYDENVFLYYEETILGFRLKSKGYNTIIINDRYVHHHSISINKTIKSTVEQRKIMYESLMYYIERYLKPNKFTVYFCKAYLSLIIYENYFDGLINKLKNK